MCSQRSFSFLGLSGLDFPGVMNFFKLGRMVAGRDAQRGIYKIRTESFTGGMLLHSASPPSFLMLFFSSYDTGQLAPVSLHMLFLRLSLGPSVD